MDKAVLKQTILGLEVDQTLTINFRGSLADQSGDFVVVGKKRGRGKGGSQLLEVTRPGDTEVLTFGTPRNEDILIEYRTYYNVINHSYGIAEETIINKITSDL